MRVICQNTAIVLYNFRTYVQHSLSKNKFSSDLMHSQDCACRKVIVTNTTTPLRIENIGIRFLYHNYFLLLIFAFTNSSIGNTCGRQSSLIAGFSRLSADASRLAYIRNRLSKPPMRLFKAPPASVRRAFRSSFGGLF